MSATRLRWSAGRIDQVIAKSGGDLLELFAQALDVRLRPGRVEHHPHEEVAGLRVVELLGVENVEPAVEQRGRDFGDNSGPVGARQRQNVARARHGHPSLGPWPVGPQATRLATAGEARSARAAARKRPCYCLTCLRISSTERLNPFDDDLDALGGRMHAVGLIEFRVACDAVEEERIKRSIVRLGQIRKDGGELGAVLAAEIGRRAHAGDEDRQLGRRGPCRGSPKAPSSSPRA